MVKVSIKRPAFDIALTRRNLSQNGLAQKLGMSRSYLSQVISGKRPPSAYMRQLILEFFKDYAFDDLFTIEEHGNGQAGDREHP
jgi:putative transcriptional regulator